MNQQATTRVEIGTCLFFAAVLLLVLKLHLLPALIAGLLVYALVVSLVPLLRTRTRGHDSARLVAVGLISAVVISLIALAGFSLISFLRHSGESVPVLINRMAEIIANSRDWLPEWIVALIPADAESLRIAVVAWLQSNAQTFQVAGTGIGRALAHILIGMVVGGLLSLETAIPKHGTAPLANALAARALLLAKAFRGVVFAQVWISAINTVFTALYLGVLLPQMGVELPFTKTLILITFLVGLLPILGNLISNTMICVVSLSQSLLVAVGSLAYLMAIHKLEYFLNARIVGSHIRARAWEIMLAMLFMEAAFGLPGLVAAPIYYAYAKDELRHRGLL
jgi:predicted PurR-regulated permease PerM